jgi:hypothetical protein
MDRRGFLAGAAAMTAIAGSARAGIDGLRTAAHEAWLYGVPLIETAGARSRMVARATAAGAPPPLNAFVHARDLADASSRGVTTPNNDTLYSQAWIDLSSGPVRITVPPTGARYFSLALMDMYTNNIRVIGLRSGKGEGGDYLLLGPPKRIGVGDMDITEPRMPRPPHLGRHPLEIRAPGTWVWALGRTLVDGAADLPAARAVQDGLIVHAKHPARTPQAYPARDAAWNDYFFAVQQLIEDNPPPKADDDFFHRIAPLQLGAEQGFERARFADDELSEIEAGIDEAKAELAALRTAPAGVGGWIYPQPDLGDFGQDYLGRAATAIGGLGALPPSEAMYMRALTADGGRLFDSEQHYRLSLPGPVPVDGFWSLSLYEPAAAGQLFFTDNPLHRYSIGDRTAGLRRRADGGLDLWIGRADPGGAHTANWLPAPAKGPFALTLRAYLPKPDLLAGRYRLPPVELLQPAAR